MAFMSTQRITLVTSADMPALYSDEAKLPDALAKAGFDPHIAVWNDPAVDWERAGICVVRSVVDYARDRQKFLTWARTVPRILNHPAVLEWNSDKHYMIELEHHGLPIIPTTWLEASAHLSKRQVHTRFPAMGDFVVKPAVSSGVRDIGRYTANVAAQRQAAVLHASRLLGEGRDVMVQRYLREVDVHGEISLVFFNGMLSHTVEKEAALHPASQTDPIVRESVVRARPATDTEMRWGEQIRSIVHAVIREKLGRDELFLYSRADVVPDGQGSFRVMEVSMVDADLYLDSTPRALANFVNAVGVRANW